MGERLLNYNIYSKSNCKDAYHTALAHITLPTQNLLRLLSACSNLSHSSKFDLGSILHPTYLVFLLLLL